PLSGDQLFAGEDNYIRWDSTLPSANGSLSVSFDEGSTWQETGSTDLASGLLKWSAPDTFSAAILKMTVEG
ncbi:hypothetical protein CWI54_27450, partial [Escherichia coli]|uniref:hypothetical protein n=1 Tax=Escherichia coli TaxID=562 RepID=UPI000CC7F233